MTDDGSADRIREEFDRILSTNSTQAIARMTHWRKVILNADDLFRMLPRYADNPQERIVLGPLLYDVARRFIDRLYAELLARSFRRRSDTIVFTAGGSASGKTTILRAAGQRPGVDFLVDTTFSNIERALSQVTEARKSGRKVEVHYVYRDFVGSVKGMIIRALDPDSGRMVPIDDMARTHFGAQLSVMEVSQRFRTDPNVSIVLSANTGPESLRRMSEEAFASCVHESVDGLSHLGQTVLDECQIEGNERAPDPNQDAAGARLHIPEAFYEAARSKTQGTREGADKGNARRVQKGLKKSTPKRSSSS